MSTSTFETSDNKPKGKIQKIITRPINKILGKFGYVITKKKSKPVEGHYLRRRKILNAHNINLVLDVGANIGQYGKKMRKFVGYQGRIVSFEPMSKEFRQLEETAASDPKWDVAHYALGNENGTGEIQISGNSVSSSLLDMLPSVADACSDEATYVGKEEISIKTLDSIFDQFCSPSDNIFLKIDTQGYERTVLEGALNSLANVSGIQLELSLTQFYKGEILFEEMLEYLKTLGFSLMAIELGLEDPKSGRLLQIDGIFFREK